MGYEITTTNVTTSFNAKDSEDICERIRGMAEHYDRYGWQPDILNAKTIEDVANTFQMKLVYLDGDKITFEFSDVYRSACFEDLLRCVAPFMSDGHVEGYSDYGLWKVVFRDGKVYLDHDQLKVETNYRSDDEIVCEDNRV